MQSFSIIDSVRGLTSQLKAWYICESKSPPSNSANKLNLTILSYKSFPVFLLSWTCYLGLERPICMIENNVFQGHLESYDSLYGEQPGREDLLRWRFLQLMAYIYLSKQGSLWDYLFLTELVSYGLGLRHGKFTEQAERCSGNFCLARVNV